MHSIQKVLQNFVGWESIQNMNGDFLKLMAVVIAIPLFFMLVYFVKLRSEMKGIREYRANARMGNREWIFLLVLFGSALIFKLILASKYEGHSTDMNCFYAWSDMIFDNGFGKFYYLDAFTDYPPGYMALLWVIAGIRRLFSIETASEAGRVLIKLIPVLSDLGAGFLLYKIAKKKFSESSSLLLAVTYILNPVVVLDSSVWGQTDGVFTLFVLLTGYFCMEEKRIPAYFCFAAGVLIKPQTLVFAPILIWTVIQQVFMRKLDRKKMIRELAWGVGAIASLFVFAAPFGLGKVISQYMDTLGSYEYCTVNAYNVWALFGKNWASQNGKFLFLEYHQWGTVAILAAVALSGLIFFKLKEDKSRYFLSMAVVVSTMFLFSVRMHERYLFPVTVLIFAAFLVKPTKELFFTYAGFSAVQTLNVGHVLYTFVKYNSTGPQGGIIGITAVLTIGLYLYMFFAVRSKTGMEDLKVAAAQKPARGRNARQNAKPCPYVLHKDKIPEKKAKPKRDRILFQPSAVLPKLGKWDFIVLFGIMLLYSAFALYDLGDSTAPETEWRYTGSEVESGTNSKTIILDMGEEKNIDMIYSFLGNYENRKFMLDLSQDGVNYERVGVIVSGSVFKWNKMKVEDGGGETYNLAKNYRYVRMESQDYDSELKELVIFDRDNNMLMPVNRDSYAELFDEQELYDPLATFRSGTYFDEIYHARTAYEMIRGRYNYENTHPPLGKFLIGLGIRVFGMNPFGWRIVGVLFGIGMLPFLYMFGRRLFGGKTWAAGALTALFAFDFMHFTQTRISTIDVYGTFFIIAMFYFMLRYAQTNFYQEKLWKQFVPLGLSAVMMGLGCASKWTAVYASAGLALFFFAIIAVRIAEYVKAKKDPQGETNGISHELVVNVFTRRLVVTFLFCVLFFIVIAGGIYMCSYLAFSDGCSDNVTRFQAILNDESRPPVTGLYKWLIDFLQEHQNGFTELLGKTVRNADTMFHYHANLKATHSYSSSWDQWPTMIKPMFYYCNTVADDLKEGISAFGNPLVWWAGIPAFFYMIYRAVRRTDKIAIFLIFTYMVQYVPWILVPRCTFAYHYFPSVPFVAMMIVYTMVILVKNNPKWLKWSIVYCAAAFALFLLFHPVLSGGPITYEFARDGLKWLDGWVLVI